ncbi:MAG: SAM-dependent chlorinase/fluorinase [Chloroflexi bacterium]|nr:SAM-dependent chlorinase/fluorinase [Chloroflexota bacterium]
MSTSFRRDAAPIITLTTDFGQQDGYVGAMQGVIFSICPAATQVNISHTIPAQDIRTAAFVLYQAFSYFPADTIHCVVVDPGVGSNRRAIAVRTSHGIFVGPDNGVFTLVLAAEPVNVLEAVTLVNSDYQLPSVSATFHGRDIFAPAAAHLANGVPLSKFGPRAINLVRLDFGTKIPNPKYPEDATSRNQTQESQVMHIDHFGNLILALTRHDIENTELVSFTIGAHVIKSLSSTFADVEEGQLLAYTGSSRDHIEIAIRNGNAAQRLGLKVGDVIKFSLG